MGLKMGRIMLDGVGKGGLGVICSIGAGIDGPEIGEDVGEVGVDVEVATGPGGAKVSDEVELGVGVFISCDGDSGSFPGRLEEVGKLLFEAADLGLEGCDSGDGVRGFCLRSGARIHSREVGDVKPDLGGSGSN